ncbi:hypothetical protein M514_05179 [Trichuris suis]|uniref:Uncharacterized protein n=1 Tax=Trichuris suis TaxID=68888 RepID=A0A085MZY3_9BILA|nr:hypothetical protein M513_05179 [Trichuris suis]KFD62779.1 hypothetical protein M514_05179 [Trichuris suis]
MAADHEKVPRGNISLRMQGMRKRDGMKTKPPPKEGLGNMTGETQCTLGCTKRRLSTDDSHLIKYVVADQKCTWWKPTARKGNPEETYQHEIGRYG